MTYKEFKKIDNEFEKKQKEMAEEYAKKHFGGLNKVIIKSELGKFFIGDICYALDENIYSEIWGDKYDYVDGSFKTDKGEFAVSSTAYGDGEYYGTDGREYGVDAGCLGVVPMELWKDRNENELNRLGRVVETKEIEVSATSRVVDNDKGLFTFKFNNETLIIKTDYEEEEE